MQRWMTFLLCIACLIPITASAHSGGTDSKGGHWNRSTGEYHYHHGYSAHQHKDMNGDGIKDCPYEFSNNTNYNETPKHKIDDKLLKETDELLQKIQVPTYPEEYVKWKESINKQENKKENKNQSAANSGYLLEWQDIQSCIIIFGIFVLFLSQFAVMINEKFAESMMQFAFSLIVCTLPFFLIFSLF